jgi:hypothetical protein
MPKREQFDKQQVDMMIDGSRGRPACVFNWLARLTVAPENIDLRLQATTMRQVMRPDTVPAVRLLEEVETATDLNGPAVVDANLSVVELLVHVHLELDVQL